ncbi:MAG: hypothetical protein HOM11_06960 [Methylococcales bacterium]|nr:hypothetical protein [Methylococcales bacterium]
MISSVLIKELSLRNFGLLYLDLSHWQSYMVSCYGHEADSVTAMQSVKHQISELAEQYEGSCYRSLDNVQFFVVLKSNQTDFKQLAKQFFNQAIDSTELIKEYQQELLKKHGIIMHSGGCHFDEIAGIRKIWNQPNRLSLITKLHEACVAESVFLTDLPLQSSHFLLASERLTLEYREQVQTRIKALVDSMPLYQQWLSTIHVSPEILPNVFDYHKSTAQDPVGQTALLMESICQDRANKSASDPYYSNIMLEG